MKEKSYEPRPGTKVALAVAAMLDGPMTVQDLAKAMSCPTGDVGAQLFAAVKNGFLVRVIDETRIRHYALANMPLDERFTKTGETEEPAKSKPNGHQGAFPSNPFPVSNLAAPGAPKTVKVPSPASHSSGGALEGTAKVTVTNSGSDGRSRGAVEAAVALAVLRKPPPEIPPTPKFVAGFFSNGELTINVDDHQLTLSKDNIIELRTFLKTIQEAA